MKQNKDKFSQRWFNLGLRLLQYRPRSEGEINLRLKRKGASPTQIDQVLQKLTRLKLIDDTEFCLWWQRQRDEHQPRSSRVIKLELKQKGVSRDIIQDTIDASESKELDRAHQALAKKFKSQTPHREKIIRFLLSRGFSWDIISQTLSQAVSSD